MPKPSYSSVVLDVDPEAKPLRLEPRDETPFRILVLGDFSGRSNRGEGPPAVLKPAFIDRDNFDEVLARYHPEIEIGLGSGNVLRFRELEDFHPDRIYRQEVFEKFRAASRLLDAKAAGWLPSPAESKQAVPDLPSLTGGSLLDSILETTESRPERKPDPLQDFVKKAVAPHVVPRPDSRIAAQAAEVAAEAAKVMREILHFIDLQDLEAAWRALDWLVRGIETGPLLKVYVLDITKPDLLAKLPELRRMMLDDSTAGNPWTLVVGNFSFSQTASDVHLLSELASAMDASGAVLLAEADPNEADSAKTAGEWDSLRQSPRAAFVGLALPRFLLRLPYGERTHPIESFPFEEMPGPPNHHNYLWGSSGFACAFLLAQSFSSEGWQMRPGGHSQIDGLPLHVYESEGEQRIKPCCEVVLDDKSAEWILDSGFMPLLSVKDSDALRVTRFQSIARPASPLAGAWTV